MRQQFSFTHSLKISNKFDCLVGQIELLSTKSVNINSIVFLSTKSIVANLFSPVIDIVL